MKGAILAPERSEERIGGENDIVKILVERIEGE
jgi:hypothetical protein